MVSDGRGSPDSLQQLSAVSPKVSALVAEAVADWAPEAPPATSVLGDIGLLLINRCDEFEDAELSTILGVVEDVLTPDLLARGTRWQPDSSRRRFMSATAFPSRWHV